MSPSVEKKLKELPPGPLFWRIENFRAVFQAPEYLLRIMNVKAPPGWRSPEHSHSGSEAFYVLKGRVGHKSSHGTHYADAKTVMNSHDADMPMQVFTASEAEVELFAMVVVDATRPFSSPAKLD